MRCKANKRHPLPHIATPLATLLATPLRPSIAITRYGYNASMIDVLMYLYETYWRPDACPEPEQLSRKLSAVGFEREEIEDALSWLKGLANVNMASMATMANTLQPGTHLQDRATPPAQPSYRIYTAQEHAALGVEGINILTALEAQHKITADIRELIVERVLANGQTPVEPEDLKVMLLIVSWCLDQEPDPLILDELFEDPETPKTYH
jgi:Smg protein